MPSNFLEEVGVAKSSVEDVGMEIFAASEQDMEQAKRIIAEVYPALNLMYTQCILYST